MTSQKFSHENELLASAPLNGEGDHTLFAKQTVHMINPGELQWDFILHDGRDWHFRQEVFHLRDDGRLCEFKDYIRKILKEETGR
jgi:hypothetical protein